jgi:hypothetical protein
VVALAGLAHALLAAGDPVAAEERAEDPIAAADRIGSYSACSGPSWRTD